jgi:glycosyltransferase involved in cell wall biosynthesis
VSFPAKLTVTSTFGIFPPRGGGQVRLFHICRHLAAHCPVEVIALVAPDDPAAERELAPGLKERRVPKSPAHAAAEAELEREAGVPVTDVAFPELQGLTPKFAEAVARSATDGGAFVACHPYTLPVIESGRTDARIWYDVQDVEADLKVSMLAANDTGQRLLSATREVERACCERAELLWVTCDEDANRLRELYGVPASRLAIVPNGVDCDAIRFTPPGVRRALHERLRLEAPIALFIGSWHEPNLQAVRRILELAPRLSRVEFAIVGSACLPFKDADLPSNVKLFGVVEDALKETLLSAAAVALNPMSEGSGTNIKMLDYLAAGLTVVSTEVGARGLGLERTQGALIVPLAEFPTAISEILSEPVEVAEPRAREGRRVIEERFDWTVVAQDLLVAAGAVPVGAEL